MLIERWALPDTANLGSRVGLKFRICAKRGPAEPPPLIIETDDPLGAFDRLLGADPKKAKSRARRKRPRRKP